MIETTTRGPEYTISTHQLDDDSRIDEQGYLHTTTSQRQPEQVVISCTDSGGAR